MIEARTKDNQVVYCCVTPDCGPNKDGYYVEICLDCDLEMYDYFCIRPEDCDCSDMNKVNEYVKNYVSEMSLFK